MKTMMSRQTLLAALLAAILALASQTEAFAPTSASSVLSYQTVSASPSLMARPAFIPSSSIEISAATLDPTTILSDIFGGFINSPIILAVPILAALGIAFLIGYLIFAYASPVVEDDEQ